MSMFTQEAFSQVRCPSCNHFFKINASPDRTPNASLVLSLDGGGIRGYSTLLILQKIMQEIASIEEEMMKNRGEVDQAELDRLRDKPSNYFDFMVGTSTGGLIAIMLGRLDMTVESCLREYELLGSEIFAKPRISHIFKSKYNHEDVENLFKRTIEKHRKPDEVDNQGWSRIAQSVPKKGVHSCKIAAVMLKETKDSRGDPYLLRSYAHPSSDVNPRVLNLSNNPCDLETWEVALATTAAPRYFKIMETAHANFLDGGWSHNNSIDLAWNEAWFMARLEQPNISVARAIGCLLSIGTGVSIYEVFPPNKRAVLKKYIRYLKAITKELTDADKPHKTVISITEPHGIPYHRFNVNVGLEKMRLDDWTTKRRHDSALEDPLAKEKISTLEYINLATQQYLRSSECVGSGHGSGRLRKCAQLLVDYRIARMRPRNVIERAEVVQNGVVH